MDDILASIRRIMLDEQARLQDGAPGSSSARTARRSAMAETVLILDSSMAVEGMPEEETLPGPIAAEPSAEVAAESAPPPQGKEDAAVGPPPEAETRAAAAVDVPVLVVHEEDGAGMATVSVTTQTIEALLAPAAAAAAASVDALLKQLSEERLALLQPAAASASPTIEEVVRSELRPLLKTWLDEHLPPLVERLVRSEINRLIGRSGL